MNQILVLGLLGTMTTTTSEERQQIRTDVTPLLSENDPVDTHHVVQREAAGLLKKINRQHS
jgi:hypothetical protein